MIIAAAFSWLQLIPIIGHDELIPGVHEETFLILTAWGVAALLIVGAVVARMSLERAWSRPGLERFFPDERLSVRTAVEVFASGIYGLVKDILGDHDAVTFFSLIASLFVYIFSCNILAIFPGFQPPTDNINANFGMGVLVFLVFNFVGMSRDFKGYLAHLWGPVLLLGPLLFVIEVIGLFIRPMSLSLRLAGNIFGDHTVFGIMNDLFPWWLPVPAIFLGLAIFVSFLQAFVFSLLSTIYIGLAAPHHDHAEESAHH